MRSLNLPHNPRLDEIRCLAASLVFLFHFHLYFYKSLPQEFTYQGWNWLALVTEGHTGVGLFFTLSGFLFMQIALHNPSISYREFIRNRFLRIFPLFITVFFIAISIGRDQFQPQDVLYILFSNLGNAPTSKYFITGAAWTISIEFAFYLVFPFISRFALEKGPRYLLQALFLMLIIKLGAYGVAERSTHMFFSTLVGRFDQFLVGMLAALAYRDRESFFRRHNRLLFLAACALVVVSSIVQARYGSFSSEEPKRPFWITWSLQESTVWAVFIITWLCLDVPRPLWLNRFLQKGGEISYSFYLLHALVMYIIYRWFGFPALTGNVIIDGSAMLILVFAATWAVSLLSFSTIEQPFLSLRHRYGKRH